MKSLVDAGSIPKLEDRLPAEPYVVPHNWVQQGKYGGNLKMNITATSGGDSSSVGELWYSFSMLRFINDGQDVVPGLVSKWTANADTSEWTFTLRKGVKWSDGKPVTSDDVLFWWKYWVNYADAAQSVPDECRSGKGTICKLTAQDELNFKMVFDAPAPLTADRLAMWTNGPGGNGPVWIIPAHYAKQFHPAFTKVPASWAGVGGLWEQNVNYKRSTKMPTLTPFKLVKYSEGRSLQWARNPYAYEVSKDGDQLPYIDTVTMTAVVDPQVGKVQITAGKVDYVQGGFNGLILADVSTLMKNKDKGWLRRLPLGLRFGYRIHLLPLAGLLRQAVPGALPEEGVPPGPVARLRPRDRQEGDLLPDRRGDHRNAQPEGGRVSGERHGQAGLHQLARLVHQVRSRPRPRSSWTVSGSRRAVTASARSPAGTSSSCASTARPRPPTSTSPRTTSSSGTGRTSVST